MLRKCATARARSGWILSGRAAEARMIGGHPIPDCLLPTQIQLPCGIRPYAFFERGALLAWGFISDSDSGPFLHETGA
jgi:hypothetical protein